ncbi:hypothetical protein R4Y45_06065 [Holzapfeliella sp. He02]|uniref:Uncharacterized protein n=1 Tax=Holzapfeliella saturejae TaxID=3082953 RepID=A0ABU8SHF7_9LACO
MQKATQRQDIAFQSWMNQQVKATKGSGKNVKPYYKNFKELYDLESEIESIKERYDSSFKSTQSKKQSVEQTINQRIEEFYKRKEDENG